MPRPTGNNAKTGNLAETVWRHMPRPATMPRLAVMPKRAGNHAQTSNYAETGSLVGPATMPRLGSHVVLASLASAAGPLRRVLTPKGGLQQAL